MRGANRADNSFADPGDDCFFGRAADEPIEMRAHSDARLDLHANTVLCDAVNRCATHVWARRVNYFWIDARAHRFQHSLASSFRGEVDGASAIEIERDASLVGGN